MKSSRQRASGVVAPGSARASTRALGGTRLIEPNMVFRYD
jgi:hypothetical protein